MSSKFPNSIYLVSDGARIPVQVFLTQIIFYLSSQHSVFTENQDTKLSCHYLYFPLWGSLNLFLYQTLNSWLLSFVYLLSYIYLYSFNSKKITEWVPNIYTLQKNKNEAGALVIQVLCSHKYNWISHAQFPEEVT